MNAWPFIAAAYGLTALGSAGVAFASWWAMRSAEARAEQLRRP